MKATLKELGIGPEVLGTRVSAIWSSITPQERGAVYVITGGRDGIGMITPRLQIEPEGGGRSREVFVNDVRPIGGKVQLVNGHPAPVVA